MNITSRDFDNFIWTILQEKALKEWITVFGVSDKDQSALAYIA